MVGHSGGLEQSACKLSPQVVECESFDPCSQAGALPSALDALDLCADFVPKHECVRWVLASGEVVLARLQHRAKSRCHWDRPWLVRFSSCWQAATGCCLSSESVTTLETGVPRGGTRFRARQRSDRASTGSLLCGWNRVAAGDSRSTASCEAQFASKFFELRLTQWLSLIGRPLPSSPAKSGRGLSEDCGPQGRFDGNCLAPRRARRRSAASE